MKLTAIVIGICSALLCTLGVMAEQSITLSEFQTHKQWKNLCDGGSNGSASYKKTIQPDVSIYCSEDYIPFSGSDSKVMNIVVASDREPSVSLNLTYPVAGSIPTNANCMQRGVRGWGKVKISTCQNLLSKYKTRL